MDAKVWWIVTMDITREQLTGQREQYWDLFYVIVDLRET